MRLIDADSLILNMDKGMQGTAREYLKFFQMAVNDEPTAYDVDKVVESIEEKILNTSDTKTGISARMAFGKSIEIVKSGSTK